VPARAWVSASFGFRHRGQPPLDPRCLDATKLRTTAFCLRKRADRVTGMARARSGPISRLVAGDRSCSGRVTRYTENAYERASVTGTLYVWATIRPETVDSIGSESILLGLAGEVRGVVGTAGSFIDSSLRVWAKGAGHVDTSAFVDSTGGDGFGGLVLFEPAFERGEGVELIGACAAAAMGLPPSTSYRWRCGGPARSGLV
jgi:hypothetical protein